MIRQLQLWKFINDSLQQNIPVMLLYVLESTGSSPGRQGFCMGVNAKGDMQGSIGGGIMEHKFVEMAKEKLKQNKDEISVRKQIHDKTAAKNQSGMICSGEQTIFIYRVHNYDGHHVQNIMECLKENKNGALQLTPSGIVYSDVPPATDFEYTYQSEEDWLYKEKLGYKNHLYIIGGGHCALAFSRIMSMMDFCIHLFDDRDGLNTFEQNNFVQEKLVVKDYSNLSTLIPDGEKNYIVVMTFGYRTDHIAVKALMHKRFKYFGLLGSKTKIDKLFAGYVEEGIATNLLQKIHAPVGLDINSQTPEEIAVSIAAEIIKIKNAEQP